MDRSTAGPAPPGRDAAHQRLARALRSAFGAPWAGELRAQHGPATAALADARAHRLTITAAIAQAQLAAAIGADDDVDGATRARNSAAMLLARVPSAPPQERLDALLWLGLVDWSVLGDVRAARDRLARAAVLARGDEHAETALATLAIRALASAVAGDLPGAATTAREAVAVARASDDVALLTLALAAQTIQRTVHAELTGAMKAGEELLALRPYAADPDEFDAIAAWAVAPALLDSGEPERCAELLLPATTVERLALLLPQARAVLLHTRVRLALERHDEDDAHRQLALLEAVGFARTPFGAALTGCTAAFVALADDRPLNAEVHATAAADAARRAPSRLLELAATRLAGAAQAALGAPEVAAERLAEAEQIARSIGAHARAELAAHERRALGGGVGADAPTAADYGLTPRQLEIAQLVASGRTNREVATTLGISEHTVNTHLRVAFARLGVTRRAALASALQQRASA